MPTQMLKANHKKVDTAGEFKYQLIDDGVDEETDLKIIVQTYS